MLAESQAACDPTEIAEQYADSEHAKKTKGIIRTVARDQDQTVEELIQSIASDALVYTPAEDTLVVEGAFSQLDSGELNPVGAVVGMMYECAVAELDMPERVKSHIASTRALDGTLEDSWDNLQARWAYHPDEGLNITIWSNGD